MSNRVDQGVPDGFDLFAKKGLAMVDDTFVPRMVTHQNIGLYNGFHLVVRKRGEGNMPGFIARLFYQVYSDRVLFAGILVVPEEIEADTVLDELRSLRPLDWWKRYALKAIASRIAAETFDPEGPYALPGDDQQAEIRAVEEAVRNLPLARRVNRITDSHLKDVARVYTEAWNEGRPPTQAVADEFRASHSTAARWVGLARKSSPPLLGPPTGSRGGTWDGDPVDIRLATVIESEESK